MAGMEEYKLYSGYSQSTDDAQWNRPYGVYPRNIERPAELALNPNVKPSVVVEDEDDVAVKKYVGLGVGLASLIAENLLSHPFVVLRRQCQVNVNSQRYHIIPITLFPVIVHLHKRQGITTLWKGLGSALVIRGMTLGIEDLLSKVTPWPKEVSWHSSLKSIGQHILLKSTSLAIVTPFYSASLVETVQSDIASEKPGIFDVFKEGMCRLLSLGSTQKGRMLPVWALVLPTVIHGLLKYFFSSVIRGITNRCLHLNLREEQKKQGAVSRSVLTEVSNQDIEVTSSLVGLIVADMLLFPVETVLHRLHLQGTRTIIDNLDTGYAVVPILTSYEGASDCYKTIIAEEGKLGLYKGFGALILQYAAHIAVIKLTKVMLTEVTNLLRSSKSKPAVTEDLMQLPVVPSGLSYDASHVKDPVASMSSISSQHTVYSQGMQ